MDERERDSLDDMKKQSYQNSLGAKQAYINALEFHIKELEDRITAGMEFSGKQATQLMEADARVKELEDIIAETKRRKTDEEIMKLWDTWREYIANGGTASWPRDGFESVISWYEERIKELEEENKVLEKEVDRLQEVFQVLNEAHIKAESHIKELEKEKPDRSDEMRDHPNPLCRP